jgi:hypothetical protein
MDCRELPDGEDAWMRLRAAFAAFQIEASHVDETFFRADDVEGLARGTKYETDRAPDSAENQGCTRCLVHPIDRMRNLLRTGRSFAVETTCSGRTHVSVLQRCRLKAGG